MIMLEHELQLMSRMLASNRYSMTSTSETYGSGIGTHEGNPLFRQSQSFASMSQYASSPDNRYDPNGMSQLALPPARGMSLGREPSPGPSSESGQAARLERGLSDDPSTFTHDSASYSPYQAYPTETYHDEAEAPILQPSYGTMSPEPSYIQPGNHSAQYPEFESVPQPTRQRQPSQQSLHGRGVSLVDTGPVGTAPHHPVRRVSRQPQPQGQHVRRSSRNQLVSPVSNNSHASNLPPGAVSCSIVCIQNKGH